MRRLLTIIELNRRDKIQRYEIMEKWRQFKEELEKNR